MSDEADSIPLTSAPSDLVNSDRALVRFLLRVPWTVLANVFFLLGSLAWLVSAVVCDAAEATQNWLPCEASALTATSLFFVDAFLYLGAWWNLKMSGRENPFKRSQLAKTRTGCARRLQQIDYLFWGTIMFLVGTALDYVTTGLSFHMDDQTGAHVTYLLSMVLWIGYALAEICRSALNVQNRRDLQARVCISWTGCTAKPASAERMILPWDLVGSMLFLFASIAYTFASTLCWTELTNVEFKSCLVFELVGGTLFLLNAIALFMEDADATRFAAALDESGNGGATAVERSFVGEDDDDALEARRCVAEASDRLQQLTVRVGEAVLEVAVRDDEH